MLIKFNKIDGFVRVYDGTRYIVLFGAEKYDSIYNKVRYYIGIKGGTTYVFSHNYARFKVDSYDFLLLEKTFNFHNVKKLIKSVCNKDKNNCYYNILLEKRSYKNIIDMLHYDRIEVSEGIDINNFIKRVWHLSLSDIF